MKIEHVGLFVQDLEQMRQFYMTYLGQRLVQNTIIQRRLFNPTF